MLTILNFKTKTKAYHPKLVFSKVFKIATISSALPAPSSAPTSANSSGVRRPFKGVERFFDNSANNLTASGCPPAIA